MWQCSGCSERHESQADTCWKCGSQREAGSNADFAGTAAVETTGRTPDAENGEVVLPELRLPTASYVAITVFFWTCPFLSMSEARQGPLDNGQTPTTSLWEIAYLLVMAGLICIPVLIQMAKAIRVFELAMRGKKCSGNILLWQWSMFRLPRTITQRHRWAAPVYYGSFAAPLVLMLVFVACGM